MAKETPMTGRTGTLIYLMTIHTLPIHDLVGTPAAYTSKEEVDEAVALYNTEHEPFGLTASRRTITLYTPRQEETRHDR